MHLLKGVGPLCAAQIIAKSLFDGIDDKVEGLQYMVKLTFVRWLIFIITLIQSVKLFALNGLPWSQVWGYLFTA
jgi:hypothetical protein